MRECALDLILDRLRAGGTAAMRRTTVAAAALGGSSDVPAWHGDREWGGKRSWGQSAAAYEH
jgi:hypothetical protein